MWTVCCCEKEHIVFRLKHFVRTEFYHWWRRIEKKECWIFIAKKKNNWHSTMNKRQALKGVFILKNYEMINLMVGGFYFCWICWPIIKTRRHTTPILWIVQNWIFQSITHNVYCSLCVSAIEWLSLFSNTIDWSERGKRSVATILNAFVELYFVWTLIVDY